MTPKEKAQARLNKVSRLYKGATTDGERQAALAKMRAIMDEWDLEVKDDDLEFVVMEQRYGIYGSYAPIQRSLVGALAKYMNCIAVVLVGECMTNPDGEYSKAVLSIFGTERDLAFLAELHKILWEQCLRSKAQTKLKGRSGHHAYVLGYAMGVAKQITEIVEARNYELNNTVTAIVAQKDAQAKEAMFRTYPTVRDSNYRPNYSDAEALEQGIEDGKKANINKNVTSGSKALPQ